MNYLELLKLALPDAIVVGAALIILALGLTRRLAATWCTAFAALGLFAARVALRELPASAAVADRMLIVTPLVSFFQSIVLWLSFFAVLLAHAERFRRNYAEYLAMLLFATVGLMLLVSSEEFLVIFIGLELTGLSLYLLTAFDKSDAKSAEAGLKYFLFGAAASAFTLFGISLVYGMAGSTQLAVIATKLTATSVPPLLLVGVVLTLVGFLFKIAAAPFHLWAPDAYQGGPLISAGFIASASKVASFFVLGKIVLIGFNPLGGSAAWHGLVAGWKPLLAAIACASILLGSFVALVQTNLRRLLAYSAVAHAGYTLLGIIAGGRDGFSAALFYSTTYAFTLLGAFGAIEVIRGRTGTSDIRDFKGLRRQSPLLAASMAIFLLSLAGLPPLPGFIGKFYLFSALLRSGSSASLVWLIAVALFGSLVSLYYYLIVLKTMLVDDTSDQPPAFVQMGGTAVVAVLAAVVLVFGLWPGGLVDRILATMS